MARPATTYRAARRNALRVGRFGGFGTGALAWWRNRKPSTPQPRRRRRRA